MAAPRNIRTKAYVVQVEGDPFTLCDVVLDEVQPNEVLVEIWYTGICHTDVVVQHGGMPLGGYPAVLGHEGAGVVRFCLEGRCGTCPHMTETNFVRPARRDAGAKSPISLLNGTKVHGQFFGQSSMSKLAVVAEASVIKVDAKPEELRTLPPLGCGYLAGAGTVFNVVKPQVRDSVAVVGMGAVGIAAMLAAKSLGVQQVIAIDVVESKLKVASSLGATHIINSAAEPDLQAALHAIIPGGPNSIIDTTGLVGVLEASVKALAHGGTLALVGVPAPTATLRINALDLLLSCKRLIPKLFELYHDGKFPVDCLAKVYPAEQLDKAIADLESGLAVCISTNVADESDMLKLIRDSANQFGRIDIMVNNAGIAPEASEPRPIWETSLQTFERTWGVNMRGVFLGCKYAGTQMMRQERNREDGRAGTIINIGSILGVLGKPGTPAYSATKGAVIAFTRAIAMDYAPHGIHCNSILPGFTRTPMISAMTENVEIEREMAQRHPLKRLGEPQDIASAAVFLASSMSDGITGLNLSVDGGLHSQLSL
ncbi:hypothetical protein J3E68DRAFT_437605 [Trichoderma sp. SZMC 28012]